MATLMPVREGKAQQRSCSGISDQWAEMQKFYGMAVLPTNGWGLKAGRAIAHIVEHSGCDGAVENL